MSKDTLYRCGWCGQPTDKDGWVLPYEVIEEMDVDWDKAEATHGECCRAEQEEQHYIEVTKDMASDAGYPEMEGQIIKW